MTGPDTRFLRGELARVVDSYAGLDDHEVECCADELVACVLRHLEDDYAFAAQDARFERQQAFLAGVATVLAVLTFLLVAA